MASARHFAKMEKKPKFQVRYRNRCRVCGRSRAFYRKFELCRICLRNLALRGEVPGVTKSSW
jgi:small subunit ribosomal protein S14